MANNPNPNATSVQIFKNETFGEIRTVDVNGIVHFVGNDVAKALGYSEPQKAVLRHYKGGTFRPPIPDHGAAFHRPIIDHGDLKRVPDPNYRAAKRSPIPNKGASKRCPLTQSGNLTISPVAFLCQKTKDTLCQQWR